MNVVFTALGESPDRGGAKSFASWHNPELVEAMRNLFALKESEYLREISIGRDGITATIYRPTRPESSAFTEEQLKAA